MRFAIGLLQSMDSRILWAAIWSLILLVLFGLLPRLLKRFQEQVGRAKLTGLVVLVAGAALTARLIPSLLLPMGAGYDIESYRIVGDLVLRGQDVYGSPNTLNRHPYLPFQMYWMALARGASRAAGVPFVKTVRLAPIAADVAIAVLLFFFLRRLASPAKALQGGLLYALNPIPVFVSAYHGQFDAIPSLFVLLAVMTWGRSQLASGVWLGLGILNKSWPVLALPSLWRAIESWRKRLIYVAAAAAVPAMGIAVYLALFPGHTSGVLGRALGYNWGVGVWGYTYLFRLASLLRPGLDRVFEWLVRNARYLTLAALGLAWVARARKESPQAGILTVLVTFFATTHAFSVQYLMWPVPLAVLNQDDRWLKRYTVAAFSYMFLVYLTLILQNHVTNLLPWPQADWFIIMPAGLPAWLVAVAWARERLCR